MQNTFYAIISHPQEQKILLLPSEGSWTLPNYHPESSWTPQIAAFNTYIKEQLGLASVVRYCAHAHIERLEGKRYASAVYVMESASATWTPPDGAHWASRDHFRSLPLTDEWPRPHVEAYFAEEESDITPPLRPPWGRKGWYDDISRWAEHELEAYNLHPLEPLQQLKQWDISSVLKVPTDGGDIYVKAIPTLFATEPRITAGLSRIFPGTVPDPLASWERPDEGRLILRDFGGQLLWDPGVDWTAMEDALRLLARMQIECAHRLKELMAIGCRNRRLEGMPNDLRALLADSSACATLTEGEVEGLQSLLPAIEQACDRLLSGPVPQTLLHGDFHGGNVALTDTGYVIFDWTDACVSHPFFDLPTIVDGFDDTMTEEKGERYLSAYLGEWEAAGYGSPQSLRETCDLALKIGPLYHAISYWHIDNHSEQATFAELGEARGYFLRLLLSRNLIR